MQVISSRQICTIAVQKRRNKGKNTNTLYFSTVDDREVSDIMRVDKE
jgi:hypothetical protein